MRWGVHMARFVACDLQASVNNRPSVVTLQKFGAHEQPLTPSPQEVLQEVLYALHILEYIKLYQYGMFSRERRVPSPLLSTRAGPTRARE